MEIKKKENNILDQKWTKAQEELLAEWSEKATCYRWLHSRSEKSYRFRNYSFTIPVIILSTLTGTANFAMDSFVPDTHKQIAMACVGGVNIFAGILSTLQNFLRYAELMESHRSCEVQWSKFGRNISVELALDPKRRKSANDFLKVSRAEYDRLIEQSPPIDDKIIKSFNTNFKKLTIKKPDICNGLDHCKIYQPPQEEKVADIMVSASNKFKLQPKKSGNNLMSQKFKPEKQLHEMNELKSLNKVSILKNSLNTNSTNIIDEIKEINTNDHIKIEIKEDPKGQGKKEKSEISEKEKSEISENENEILDDEMKSFLDKIED
tara:strand:+ start:17 stop:979 length:963 start_codon:yes stop_codon:yes gene_type:complete